MDEAIGKGAFDEIAGHGGFLALAAARTLDRAVTIGNARPSGRTGGATHFSARRATHLWRAGRAGAPPRTASAREPTSSLARIDSRWCSTVRAERDRRVAISALRQPAATSSSTWSSRAVRPAALRRVAASAPRGTERTPALRIAAAHALGERQRRRAGRASASASRCAASSPSARARARSYGQPMRVPRRRPPRASGLRSAAETARRRRRAGPDRGRRASARTRARRGTRGGASAPRARRRDRPRRRRAPLRPSSQASSARAAATGASRCSVFERSAASSASSSTAAAPGSPRRLRSRPSATRATTRLVVPAASLRDDRVGALAGELPAAAVDVAQRLPALHVAGEAVEVVRARVGDAVDQVALGGLEARGPRPRRSTSIT